MDQIEKKLKSAKVPKEMEDLFNKAETFVSSYFSQKKEDASRGLIEVSNERYILIRAASMSVEFFKITADLFKDKGKDEANIMAKSLLFDLAHAIGRADAKTFHKKMSLRDPIERLSAGPIHFAYTGWAFVDIFPESKPSPDENFYLIYDHPYSFESDSWIRESETTDSPVCIMNSGYSSGWCEESFGVPLVATEIMCRAKGDPCDRFIMAHPKKIQKFIEDYLQKEFPINEKVVKYEIPGFFGRKIQEEELKKKNEELEELNSLMVGRELKMIEMEKEIEDLRGRVKND